MTTKPSISISVMRTVSGKFRWQLKSFSGDQIVGGVVSKRSIARTMATNAKERFSLTKEYRQIEYHGPRFVMRKMLHGS